MYTYELIKEWSYHLIWLIQVVELTSLFHLKNTISTLIKSVGEYSSLVKYKLNAQIFGNFGKMLYTILLQVGTTFIGIWD